MVDYLKPFKVGLDQALTAQSNRQEIARVFDELNRQLAEATANQVTVQTEQFTERSDELVFSFKPRPKYWAISARHKNYPDARHFELARWSEGPSGYPCKISRRDTEIYCENKTALEEALADILRDPWVGEVFLRLMNLPAPNIAEK